MNRSEEGDSHRLRSHRPGPLPSCRMAARKAEASPADGERVQPLFHLNRHPDRVPKSGWNGSARYQGSPGLRHRRCGASHKRSCHHSGNTPSHSHSNLRRFERRDRPAILQEAGSTPRVLSTSILFLAWKTSSDMYSFGIVSMITIFTMTTMFTGVLLSSSDGVSS